MRKAIITGATGTIGNNLIRYLLEQNVEILVLVKPNSRRTNTIPINDNIKILECNISDIENLEINEKDFDTFFHLAWAGTFGEDRNNTYMQNLNVKYTLDAVKLASRCGCKTFIGTGSQAEYGRVEGKISEDTPTFPENGYGIAKLCAGKLSKILANQLGMKHIWTRIFSIYGPYDGEKTMIMSSIKEMLENNSSPSYTKGEQIWDYLYTEDAARALYLLAIRGTDGKTYNIGSGQTKRLYEYITILKNSINPKIKLKLGNIEYSKNQVMNLNADISELTEDTGFKPEISFEEGIIKTIDWYKKTRIKNEEN